MKNLRAIKLDLRDKTGHPPLRYDGLIYASQSFAYVRETMEVGEEGHNTGAAALNPFF